jgi:hypothetical protein
MFGMFLKEQRWQCASLSACASELYHDRRARRHLPRVRPLAQGFEQLEARTLLDGLSWTAGPALPTAVGGAETFETGLGTLLIGGATTATGNTTPTTARIFDPYANAWTTAPAADQGRFAGGIGETLSSGKYASNIFLFGGANQGQPTATSHSYNPYSDEDSVNPPSLATARFEFAYATDPNTGDLYALGGLNSAHQALSSVERYDPTNDAWSLISPLPQALSSATAALDGAGHILVFGGTNSAGAPVSTVYSYTIATDSWATMAAMPVAESGAAAVFGAYGQVYLIGGRTTSGATSNVFIFNPVLNEWTSDAPLPTAVYDAAATIDAAGNLDVMGGFNSAGAAVNTFYQSPTLAAPVGLPAVPDIVLDWGGYTYDGAPQPSQTIVVGSDGATPVNGTLTLTYNGSSTPPMNAGSYNVVAAFTSSDPNYVDTVTQGTFYIDPATPAIALSGGGTITYDGSPHPIVATATGVDGSTPVAGSFAYTYNGSSSPPVGPGSYAAIASFTSADPNYTNSSASTTITIPDPTIPTGVTAVGASTTSIQVSWNPVAGADHYNVYEKFVVHDPKGSGSTTYYNIVAGGVTGTSATISVPYFSSHTFYVTSVSAANVESPRSAPASAATLSAPSLYSMLWGGAVTTQATVEVGQTLNVTLLGYGNLSPTYTIDSGPSTMSVDPATGVVTYAPTASEVGYQTATFTATNSTGSSTATFTFHVLAQPTIVVTGGTFTYDGSTHGATAVAYASDGVTPISGTFNILYAPASYPSALGSAPYAEPGSYIVQATFTSSDPNYGGGSGSATIQIIPPASVAQVLVDGTAWSPSYLSNMQNAGLGNGQGYAIPAGSAQALDLPWGNVNQIRIAFNENVNVQENSLSVTGVTVPQSGFSAFTYDSATHTAVWTLSAPIGNDRVQLHLSATGANAVTNPAGDPLDGDWTDQVSSFPSGNGTAGGDFNFGFNVLPGDLNQDGIVNSQDLAAVSAYWLQPTSFANTGGGAILNSQDLATISSDWLATLPSLVVSGASVAAASVSSASVALSSPAIPPVPFVATAQAMTALNSAALIGPMPFVLHEVTEANLAVRASTTSQYAAVSAEASDRPALELAAGKESVGDFLSDEVLESVALGNIASNYRQGRAYST